MENMSTNLESLVDKLAEKVGLAADMVAPLAGDLVRQYETQCLVYIVSNALLLSLFSLVLFLFVSKWRGVFASAVDVSRAGDKLFMSIGEKTKEVVGSKMMTIGIATVCFYIIAVAVSFIGVLVVLDDLRTRVAYYVSPLVVLVKMF